MQGGGAGQTSGLPGSFPGENTDNYQQNSGVGAGNTTTGPHTSNLANRADPTVDSDRSRGTTGTGLGGNQQAGLGGPNTAGPHASNLANRADPTVDSDRSRGTTGLGNTQSSGFPSSATSTTTSSSGPHSSNLENKIDPRVDSDRSRGTTGSGIGGQNTGLSSGPTSSKNYGSNLGQSDPTFDDVPRSASGGVLNSQTSPTTSGNSGTTNAGPHNSSILNRVDPRVVSGLGSQSQSSAPQGSSQGSSHLGRDAAALGTAGAVGEGVHHHRENERDNLGSGNTGLGNTSSSNPSTGTPGYGTTSSSNPTGTSGYGNTSTGPTNTTSGGSSHLGRDAAALGTAGAVGEGVHHHRENERDNLGSGNTGLGNTSSTNPTTGTSGYGSTSSTNPTNTTSGLRNESSAYPNQGASDHGNPFASTHQSSNHHLGRDAAALGTAGAVGEGVHHHRNNERDNFQGTLSKFSWTDILPYASCLCLIIANQSTDNGTVGGTSGPHSTDIANRLDPHVNQGGATNTEDAHHHSKKHGGGAEEADHHHSKGSSHLGRDAAVGAGGVGLAEQYVFLVHLTHNTNILIVNTTSTNKELQDNPQIHRVPSTIHPFSTSSTLE